MKINKIEYKKNIFLYGCFTKFIIISTYINTVQGKFDLFIMKKSNI